MSTIYGVYISGGEYEEAYHDLIKAWSTRAAADQHVVQLTDERTTRVATYKMRDDFHTTWEKEHPSTYPYLKPCQYPKWTGLKNSEITQAMRDERNAIKAEWQRQADEFGKYLGERHQQCEDACDIYLRTQNVSEQLIQEMHENTWFSYHSEVRHTVEEIEFD